MHFHPEKNHFAGLSMQGRKGEWIFSYQNVIFNFSNVKNTSVVLYHVQYCPFLKKICDNSFIFLKQNYEFHYLTYKTKKNKSIWGPKSLEQINNIHNTFTCSLNVTGNGIKSNAVKRNIAQEPGMLGPWINANWKWSSRRWQEWISTF